MKNKSKNIIEFYLIATKLKTKIRKGWIEVDIKKERLESVAEHIYGCLILAIGMDSEYDLNLDMYKVLKMITLHELEECVMMDYTDRSIIPIDNKIELGKKCVHEVVKGLLKSDEIELLLDEFNSHNTKESKFCYLIDKIECDFQAKVYDLEGAFSYEKAKEDLPYYGDRASEIEEKSNSASDFWIEWDRPKYLIDEKFINLLNEIKDLK